MNCVKCGREIPEDQVFCEVCLTEMENYPVKPGTAVHIPARAPEGKQPPKPVKKKHVPTVEELLLRTRKKLRRTRIFAVILLLICAALCFLFAQVVLELDFQRILGQNYRTDKNQAATKPASEWTQLITLPTEDEAVAHDAAEEPSVTTPVIDLLPAPAPTEAPTTPPTAPPTEPPTEPATQPPTEVPTETPTQAPTETPAVPTEPVPVATEVPAETAAPASAEPAAEFATEPAAEPTAVMPR